MNFLNKRSGEASFLLLSAVCGMAGSACVNAVGEDESVEKDKDSKEIESDDGKIGSEYDFDVDDEYDYEESVGKVESAWNTLMKILLISVPTVSTAGAAVGGIYLYLKPEKRKRVIDTLLGGRYVDIAKADELREELEKKIDDLDKLMKEKEAQSEKEKKVIEEALKKQEEGKSDKTGDKVEEGVPSALEMMTSELKACKDELNKLRETVKELEKNPGDRKLEEDYRSRLFKFCDKIKNKTARNFFKNWFFLSAGNSDLFNIINLLCVLFVVISFLKVVIKGNKAKFLLYNTWGPGAYEERPGFGVRIIPGVLGAIDIGLSFCAPYWGFISAAAKGVTSIATTSKGVYDYLTGDIDANRLTGTINVAARINGNSINVGKIQGFGEAVKDVVKSGLVVDESKNIIDKSQG